MTAVTRALQLARKTLAFASVMNGLKWRDCDAAISAIDAALAEPGGWQPIKTAPKDGRQVLACFKGQFEWIIFLAHATSAHGVMASGHAAPTHWMTLPDSPKS